MEAHTCNSNIIMRGHNVASYSSVGSYPMFYVTVDGVLCPACVDENLGSCTDPEVEAWFVIGHDANWEDPHFYCERCDSRIPSAYGPDQEG